MRRKSSFKTSAIKASFDLGTGARFGKYRPSPALRDTSDIESPD